MNDKYTFVLGVSPVLIFLGASIDSSMLSEANFLIQELSSINFLGYLGVILTLSIGLLVQIFFLIDRIEYGLDQPSKKKIRSEIRSTARSLVTIFGFSIAVLFGKSVSTPDSGVWLVLSGVQIWLLLFYVLILYDVVMAVFEFDR
jgi:hypothetical protein